LQGATEWWVMGLAQIKQTSTSPSALSSWVSFLTLKLGSLPDGAGFCSSAAAGSADVFWALC
jgi:hypothetical protein